MAASKLSDEDKREIFELYRQPEETTSTLAKRYGVSVSTISRLLKSQFSSQEYEDLVRLKRLGNSRGASGSRKGAAPEQTQDIPVQPQEAGLDASFGHLERKTLSSGFPGPISQAPTSQGPAFQGPAFQGPLDDSSTPSQPETMDEDLVTESGRRKRRRSSAASSPSELPFPPPKPSPRSSPLQKAESPQPVSQLNLWEAEPASQRQASPAFAVEAIDLDLESDETLPFLGSLVEGEEFGEEEDEEDFEEEEEGDGLVQSFQTHGTRQALQVLPFSQAKLPRICYLVIDRTAELVTCPLRDFEELGTIPTEEAHSRTLPLFDNHRVARRFSKRNQRVIKVPEAKTILPKTTPWLEAKGIKRLLLDGQVYALGH
jgi:hypothetical protein